MNTVRTDNRDMHYLRLLSNSFPNIAAASTEIITFTEKVRLSSTC